MWRRHVNFPIPFAQAICTTCMQLLPLVAMHCRWELQEDCSDLRALMLRFDSEVDLASHALGRSLLFMVRDEDAGIGSLQQHAQSPPQANLFDEVRHRLAAVDLAIRDLHEQVHLVRNISCIDRPPRLRLDSLHSSHLKS